MKSVSRKTIRNKLDKIVSEVVRSRGYCVWCGNKRYELLQCAHIYSRANLAVRWDLTNCLCLCAACHFRGHQKPLEFSEFVREHLGDFKYTELRHRANSLKAWAVYELIELYDRYKEIK